LNLIFIQPIANLQVFKVRQYTDMQLIVYSSSHWTATNAATIITDICYPPSSSSTPASHPLGILGSTSIPSTSSVRADVHPSTPSAVLPIRILLLLVNKRCCILFLEIDGCDCILCIDDLP